MWRKNGRTDRQTDELTVYYTSPAFQVRNMKFAKQYEENNLLVRNCWIRLFISLRCSIFVWLIIQTNINPFLWKVKVKLCHVQLMSLLFNSQSLFLYIESLQFNFKSTFSLSLSTDNLLCSIFISCTSSCAAFCFRQPV